MCFAVYCLSYFFGREAGRGGGVGDLRYLRIPQPPTQEQGSLSGKTEKVTNGRKSGVLISKFFPKKFLIISFYFVHVVHHE